MADIYTDAGVPILYGRKLLADWPLFDRFADIRLPAGQTLVVDLDGTRADPARTSLGGRAVLAFVPTAEGP